MRLPAALIGLLAGLAMAQLVSEPGSSGPPLAHLAAWQAGSHFVSTAQPTRNTLRAYLHTKPKQDANEWLAEALLHVKDDDRCRILEAEFRKAGVGDRWAPSLCPTGQQICEVVYNLSTDPVLTLLAQLLWDEEATADRLFLLERSHPTLRANWATDEGLRKLQQSYRIPLWQD